MEKLKKELSEVEVLRISNHPLLDPITVVFFDYGRNSGKIIVECYGSAWSAYWGAMGTSIFEFISNADAEYLTGKLLPNDRRVLKRERVYLLRIIEVVKEVLSDTCT